MATDYSVRLTGQDNLTPTLKGAKQAFNDLSSSSRKLDTIRDKFNRIENSAAPLKRKLRDLQALMAEMNLNELADTDVFTQIAAQAGTYKDAIGDAAQATRLLSSDTAGLDAGMQALTGLTAVANVATGVMGLLGFENDNVQQAILRVQSALAILNGVQTLANILNKDSILMLKLKQIQQVAVTAATGANTVAEGANTVATGANTIATKAWNIAKAISKALLGDFTGLILVGAGALAAYALCTSDSTEKQKELNEATDGAKEIQTNYLSSVSTSSGELVGKYQVLRTEWNNLRTEAEQIQWLEDNKTALENLGLGVYDVVTAERVFNGQTSKVIQALEARARAMAAMEAMVETYKEMYKRKQAVMNSVAGGGYYTKATAGATNKESVLTGEWEGLQEGIHWVWKGDGIFGNHRELTEAGAAAINAKRNAAAVEKMQTNLTAIDKEFESEIKYYSDQMTQNSKLAEKLTNDLGTGVISNKKNPKKVNPPKKTENSSTGSTGTTEKEDLQPEYSKLKKAADDAEKKLREAITIGAPQTTIDKLTQAYNDAEKALQDIQDKMDEQLQNEQELLRHRYELSAEKITQAKEDYEKGIITREELDNTINAANAYLKNNNLKPIAVKIEPEEGSIEAYEKEISDIDKRLNEENLDIATRIKLMDQKADVQRKIDEITNGEVSIKVEIEPTYTKKGSLQDKRSSKQNADSRFSQIQSDYESGLIDQDEAKKQIAQLNSELAKLGLEPIKVDFDSSGAMKTVDEMRAAVLQLADTFRQNSEQTLLNWLGNGDEVQQQIGEQLQAIFTLRDNMIQFADMLNNNAKMSEIAGAGLATLGQAMTQLAGDGEAAKVGATMAAIGQIILGFATAAAKAGSMGPWGWLVYVGVGLAAVATVISTIKSYADGGIIGGNSFHGDKIFARVNAGEMILNPTQQANLFRMLNNGGTNERGGKVEFKISGSTLKGVLRNYDNKMNKIRR